MRKLRSSYSNIASLNEAFVLKSVLSHFRSSVLDYFSYLDAVDGDGLLTAAPAPPAAPLFLLFMLLIVVDMVCLAACLARSVDTKLLTRSFRLPFISGEESS